MGGVAELSVQDNVNLLVLDQHSRGGRLRHGELQLSAREILDGLNVRPSDPRLRFDSLSGGNQQKVMLAKWLRTRPSLLLLDEPTQGVDVGAREEIFDLVRSIATAGSCVLCSSSDQEQLAKMCTRVLIFREGMVVGEVAGRDVTEESINAILLENGETRHGN